MAENASAASMAVLGKRVLDSPGPALAAAPRAKRPRPDMLQELRALVKAQNWTELKSRSEAFLMRVSLQQSQSAEHDFEKSMLQNFLGVAKANLKDVAGSLLCFRAALKADPTNDKAALNEKRASIEVMMDTDNFVAAKARLEELLTLEPDQPMWLQCELGMLRKLGEFPKIRARIEECLVKRPHDVSLHHELGVVCQQLGDRDASVAAFRQAALLGKGDGGVHSVRLAVLDRLRKAKDWQGLKAKCVEYLVTSPEAAYLHHSLGEVNEELGNPLAALSAYKQAVLLEPNNEFYIMSATTVKLPGIRSRDHWNTVKATCEQLIDKSPHCAHLHSQLGFAKRYLGEHDGAAAAFSTAAELTARKGLASKASSNCLELADRAKLDKLRLAGDWTSFENLARELIAQKPEVAMYHEALAKAHRRRGDRQAMVDSLREAARLDPEMFTQKFQTASVDMIGDEQGIAQVEAHVTSLLQIGPPSPWLYVDLGFAQYLLGKRALGLNSFRQALVMEPDCHHLEVRLEDFSDSEGDDWAKTLCEALICLQPHNAFLHGMLGNVLRTQEDLEGSLAAFREAARLLPDGFYTRQVQKTQLLLLRAKGDWESVKERCQSLLAASPDAPGLHHRLGRVWERLGDFGQACKSYHEAMRLAPNEAKYATDAVRADRFVCLPEVSFCSESFPAEQACCHICLEEYLTGDVLRRLPCGHHLHSDCASRALAVRSRRGCPVCRRPVFEEEVVESSSEWDSDSDDVDDSDTFSDFEHSASDAEAPIADGTDAHPPQHVNESVKDA